jgi:nitronate monooxygenase
VLDQIAIPIVQAPMAGGPSTPELCAAVSGAGGLGFLAAGYRSVEQVRADIAAVRARTDAPFGLNIFAPPGPPGDAAAVEAYRRDVVTAEARRQGADVGEARHDDDAFAAKVQLAAGERIPVVSFTFGLPTAQAMPQLKDAGAEVWITVTEPGEARAAAAAGADALVVQGLEAGGHRGYFRDDGSVEDYGLLALLRRVALEVDLPLVATGGIADGAAVAAVLCAGAAAAQIGSALMLTPEAATSAPHRLALSGSAPTGLTRAFSGRTARGIVNRFMSEHGADAPAAYPEVNHLTSPLRAAARAGGDAGAINLWAGQAYSLARALPAAEVVRVMAGEARVAAARAAERLG